MFCWAPLIPSADKQTLSPVSMSDESISAWNLFHTGNATGSSPVFRQTWRWPALFAFWVAPSNFIFCSKEGFIEFKFLFMLLSHKCFIFLPFLVFHLRRRFIYTIGTSRAVARGGIGGCGPPPTPQLLPNCTIRKSCKFIRKIWTFFI